MIQRKVAIVGAGAVGSTFAYALAQSGLADEIVLIDHNKDLARGQALDLAHGQPFFPAVTIRDGDPSDYKNARLIVVTAGAAQQPGETRIELLRKNAKIMRNIATDINDQQSKGVVLIVSNPVDVMTYIALQSISGDQGRVFGSGTVLDSARLRYFISKHCGVDVHNVHAYILGEHGDSEFAAWSMTHIGGIPIRDFCPICNKCNNWKQEQDKIEQQVRDSAYHIIDYKGATWFAVGMAMVRIARAILRGEKSVLTVSTKLDGEFGLHDVCLSVPCIVSANGVEQIIANNLPESEMNALSASASVLKEAIKNLESKE